jgi:hypothetical protein
MRLLSPVFAFLVWLLVLAVGAFLIADAIYPDLLYDVIPGYLSEHGMQPSFRALVALAGVILVLIVLSRLLSMASGQEGQGRFISFPSTHGTTRISVGTVQAFLARAGATLPDVKKLETQVTPLEGRASPNVEVTAWVHHGRNARELCDRIGQYINDSTKDLLGVEEIGEVNVTLREIEPGPGAAER